MNNPTGRSEILQSISDGMVDAVESAAEFTVLVNARKRMPVSGLLVSQGIVLTVDHGIEREEHIQVILPGDTEAAAVLVGRDPGTDLAVLRIQQDTGRAVRTAAKPARVGQPVIALGKPEPAGVQASFGIVTALGEGLRTMRGSVLDKYIATDATPYPGFSGGPLLSLTGEVVGLNTSGLVGGSSLAIPIHIALGVLEQIAAHGKVKRGYLGIRSQLVEIGETIMAAENIIQKTGLLLVGLEPQEPAERGGMLVGDILISINDKNVTDQDDLFMSLSGDVVGKATTVKVIRGGRLTTMTVTIGERA
jgi:S1-C subfamily serine protease